MVIIKSPQVWPLNFLLNTNSKKKRGCKSPLKTMKAIINIYECVYRTEQGKELYTKTWYAPTWEYAFRMAEIYRTVTLHEAFDFILKRI